MVGRTARSANPRRYSRPPARSDCRTRKGMGQRTGLPLGAFVPSRKGVQALRKPVGAVQTPFRNSVFTHLPPQALKRSTTTAYRKGGTIVEEPKPGSYTHIEIPCKDKEKAKEFYGNVFGWKFEDVPEMDYTLFEAPSPPHGGLFVPEEGQPSGVMNHILVESADETIAKIQENGGTILVPKTEIPKIGWFAVFQDPDGAVQAIFENMPQPQE